MRTLRMAGALPALALLAACGGDGGSSEPASESINGFVNTSIVERDADGTVVFRATQRLDAVNDRLIEEGENLVSGLIITGELQYDRSGNLERSTFTNTLDDAVTVRTFVFEHEADGRLRSFVVTTDENGQEFVETERLGYDEENRLVSRELRDGLENDGDLLTSRRYEYTVRGATLSGLVRRPGLAGAPDDIEREYYTYDTGGKLVGVRFDADDDGTTDRSVSYEYDGAGNVVRFVARGADGAVLRTGEFGYEAVDERVYNRLLRVFRYFFF